MIINKRLLCLSIVILTMTTITGCQSKTEANDNITGGRYISNNVTVANAPEVSTFTKSDEKVTSIEADPTIYRIGSTGDQVKRIQEDLKNLGYSIDVDGNFGQGTKNAISDFQTRTGLKVDGEVGEGTMSKLDEDPTDKSKYCPIDYSNFNADTKEGKEAFMNTNTFFSDTPFFIITNLEKKEINIFTGTNKKWSLIHIFKCSIGSSSTPTITGRYRINLRGTSFGKDKGFECKYFTQIHENFLFHSIVYDLDGSVRDGRLGYAISHGCIRLATDHAKWIYDNIPKETQVIIK